MNNNYVSIKITGKGNKIRIVPIDNNMSTLLKQYIIDFSLNSSDKQNSYLFKNHLSSKITRQGITHILKKYYLKAINSNLLINNNITISPHTLRHSRAVHLLMSGVDLIYIRDILGHTSVKTTEIYSRIYTNHKRKALESLSNDNIKNQLPEWHINQDLMDWLNSFI
jgi:site-specific recombinase XerD